MRGRSPRKSRASFIVISVTGTDALPTRAANHIVVAKNPAPATARPAIRTASVFVPCRSAYHIALAVFLCHRSSQAAAREVRRGTWFRVRVGCSCLPLCAGGSDRSVRVGALSADHGGRVAVTNQLRSYEPEKPPLAARSHTTLSGHGCQPHAGMWPRSTQGVEHRRDGDEVHSLLHLPLLCDLLEILPRQHVVVPLREPLAREQDV